MTHQTLWAILWRQNSRSVDGPDFHIMHFNGIPLLFRTREACRKLISERYGYIRDREDLKAYPHGWMMPQAVRVELRRKWRL